MPNLFVDRVNIVDKKFGRGNFGLETEKIWSNMQVIRSIFLKCVLKKVMRAFWKALTGKKMTAGTRLGSAELDHVVKLTHTSDQRPWRCRRRLQESEFPSPLKTQSF